LPSRDHRLNGSTIRDGNSAARPPQMAAASPADPSAESVPIGCCPVAVHRPICHLFFLSLPSPSISLHCTSTMSNGANRAPPIRLIEPALSDGNRIGNYSFGG